jgi:HlyD family secretion protein
MIRHKKVMLLIPLLLLATLTFFLLKGRNSEKPVVFETATVKRGTIAQTISATGTVEPIDKVEVGTQVSGVVKKIHVDFNSTVTKGQLLAELDKTTLLATLDLSKVSLKSAQIESEFLKQKFERTSKLFEKGMVSQQEIDQATYEYERAKNNVEKALSEVKKAELNLSYATIYSPINGTVLSRAVDEGQTVAASLNAPTLFTIAQDMTQMEVYAAVDEADIGQVKKGQRVIFTVDAFPEDTFHGNVSQVRLEPVVTSNVVTYTVTVLAQNPDLKLMPGMTATITVYLNEVNDVLTVPARALRFTPDENLLNRLSSQFERDKKRKQGAEVNDPGSTPKMRSSGSQDRSPAKTPGMRKRQADPRSKPGKGRPTVWIKKGETIRPVHIKTGLSDFVNVQVIEGLEDGDEVILSVRNESLGNKKEAGSESVNPFMPQRPPRGTRRMR